MVEWKKLGDVANLVRGRVISKDYIRDNAGDYPVYSSQTANDGVLGCINTFMFDGDFLTWTTDGAYAGTIFRRKGKFNITNVCGLIDIKDSENIIQDYLYYWLSLTAKSYVLEGMGNPKLMSNVASTIRIPIPSKAEQTRIVGILDTFTSAIANLKEQIKERRKQYEYYRDQLLDLEGKDGVEMKTIKDICVNICSGGTPSTTHKEYYNGNIPWLRTQEVDWKDIYDTEIKITEDAIANSSAKIIPPNCVIVAMYGATAAKVAINRIPLSTNQACCNLEIDTKQVLEKYVFQWLCKEYLNLKALGEGSQSNINGKKVKDYCIPIPPKQEQSRIVSILDQFESSIANLEAQLKEREKQYEHYRNQLLTFE